LHQFQLHATCGGARTDGAGAASVFHECPSGQRKLAVKVVDIFGNDTMTIVEVSVWRW